MLSMRMQQHLELFHFRWRDKTLGDLFLPPAAFEEAEEHSLQDGYNEDTRGHGERMSTDHHHLVFSQ